MIFALKMTEFYIKIARKNFSPNFRGSHVPPCGLAPRLRRLYDTDHDDDDDDYNVVGLVNEVTLRRAGLVLRCVTILVFNQVSKWVK